MLGQRTNETLAAARNLLHSKGNWPWANDIRVGLEALLASTLEGTALSKEFQLEAPTAWPENTVIWVFLPLGNTGISVPGPYPVADRTREIVPVIQENWLPRVFWDLLETVEAVQTTPSVFTRGNGPHDFLRFHVLFGRELWTHTEGTLRKESAAGAPTQSVGSLWWQMKWSFDCSRLNKRFWRVRVRDLEPGTWGRTPFVGLRKGPVSATLS